MMQPTGETLGDVAAWITGLPGHWEVIIVILAILLLFGGKKLPELARGLARGLRIFKQEIKGIKTDIEAETPPDDQPGQQAPKPDAAGQQGQGDKPQQGPPG